MSKDILPSDYEAFLQSIKTQVQQAQLRALVAVNKELILLYWHIGRDILERQEKQGWGAKVIDRLSDDLHHAFPQIKGFSSRNLKYMRAFAAAYPDEQFVQAALAQITWYHHITLLEKVKDEKERFWYIQKRFPSSLPNPCILWTSDRSLPISATGEGERMEKARTLGQLSAQWRVGSP